MLFKNTVYFNFTTNQMKSNKKTNVVISTFIVHPEVVRAVLEVGIQVPVLAEVTLQ